MKDCSCNSAMGEHLCEKIRLAEKRMVTQRIFINRLIRDIDWTTLSEEERHHLFSLEMQMSEAWEEYEEYKEIEGK